MPANTAARTTFREFGGMYKKIPDREQLQARAAILSAEDELSDTEINAAESSGMNHLLRVQRYV
jgi:hypothetical protein